MSSSPSIQHTPSELPLTNGLIDGANRRKTNLLHFFEEFSWQEWCAGSAQGRCQCRAEAPTCATAFRAEKNSSTPIASDTTADKNIKPSNKNLAQGKETDADLISFSPSIQCTPPGLPFVADTKTSPTRDCCCNVHYTYTISIRL